MNNRGNRIFFTRQLMNWHASDNDRSLPWKSEKDPYKIWLSEIILQQTRAQQGLPYYLRFIQTYPSIQLLAAANDDDVFRLWQGLGYYNRCKNMLATARQIVNESAGLFPADHESILGLKGVGPYTAAAIASFAFGLPHAVIDGNVYRVLARFWGMEAPYDTTEGKKLFASLAQELLDKKNSAAYNQAIMDLGATVCVPANPSCSKCPLNQKCIAYDSRLIELLPLRSKKQAVRNRYFHFLLLNWKDTLWVEKRPSGDIWENLYQPYLIEGGCLLTHGELVKNEIFRKLKYTDFVYKGQAKQRLTHQLIESTFYSISLSRKPDFNETTGKWVKLSELKKTAFPKTVISFFENNLYF
jgi:A/G-specific adenine glycosylase